MPSTIVALLAQRPDPELREMQSKLEAKRAELETERGRIDFELGQVTDALAQQARRTGGRQSYRRRPARPGATQKRILDAAASADGPIRPVEIITAMEAKGATPSRGSIHNTIARLVKTGLLTKLGEGQYQLASRNGSPGGVEPNSGPTENETTEPLSTATGFQVR